MYWNFDLKMSGCTEMSWQYIVRGNIIFFFAPNPGHHRFNHVLCRTFFSPTIYMFSNFFQQQDSDISAYTYERTLQAEQRKQMLSKMKLSKKQTRTEVWDLYFHYLFLWFLNPCQENDHFRLQCLLEERKGKGHFLFSFKYVTSW